MYMNMLTPFYNCYQNLDIDFKQNHLKLILIFDIQNSTWNQLGEIWQWSTSAQFTLWLKSMLTPKNYEITILQVQFW